jgi:hypothetical protein
VKLLGESGGSGVGSVEVHGFDIGSRSPVAKAGAVERERYRRRGLSRLARSHPEVLS